MSATPVVDPDVVVSEKRSPFGRNQIISCAIFAAIFAATYGLVWVDKVTGAEWLAFAQWFGPISTGIILGVAGTVDVVKAIKGSA